MAGINVPSYDIFKIGTDKLKYYNWDLKITKKEALMYEESVSLFEGQEFRLISKILKRPPSSIDYSRYILCVVIDKKSDFKRATSKKGIKVNGVTYRRFVGTTGGLKDNTLIFVNTEVLDELNERCECGRDKTIKLVPAKYEAYKALTCSASQEIISPNGILVVPDYFTKFKDTVITLDNSSPGTDAPKMCEETIEIENNGSDGYNLCTIGFMKKIKHKLGLHYTPAGVCLRNAWLKGMLYPFPIIEFVEKYNNGSYMVKDIWGQEHDIRNIEMILTESSLKLWSSYSSIDEYIRCYKEAGYEFAVTKIAPNILEDEREINYQYLQSYDLSDKDIEELCKPTVKYLKDSLCGDYEQTLKFLGVNGNADAFTWQQALQTSSYMLGDKFVIDNVNKLIKKKIDNAKIGKLLVEGNYQILCGDAFGLMQSVCGLEPTGILEADECYSKYWVDKDVDEVVIFRSPMTSHNNIRKCKVKNNDEVNYWYQYMNTIMVINSWDTFCMAENGADYDGDIVYSTNNPVLFRCHKKLPAINCLQSTSEKVIVNEKDVLKSNLNGMGNAVGKITNRATSMMDVQAGFKVGSPEWEELQYRITCVQDYQQNELDKIKGIISKPMPPYWYNLQACGSDEFLQSVCTYRKPYFMIYVYPAQKTKYSKYIKTHDTKCQRQFGCSLEEFLQKDNKSKEEENFVFWYNRKLPVGCNPCTMNKICWYIESQFKGYTSALKHNSDYDYSLLKIKRRCTEEHRMLLRQLCRDFNEVLHNHMTKQFSSKTTWEGVIDKEMVFKHFRQEAKNICPSDDERLNIILDIGYKESNSMQFCWVTIGDLIVNRLKEMEKNKNENSYEHD